MHQSLIFTYKNGIQDPLNEAVAVCIGGRHIVYVVSKGHTAYSFCDRKRKRNRHLNQFVKHLISMNTSINNTLPLK